MSELPAHPNQLPHPNQRRPGSLGEVDRLLAYSLDVLTVLDADGSWRYSSPAGTELLGHRPGYDPEGGIFSLVHPDDLAAAEHVFGQLVAGTWDSSTAVELRVQVADGSYRILENYARNLCDDPGVRGLIVNSRDITERRNAESALRSEDRRFRSLVQHVSEYTLVWDADFNLSYVSPSVIEATAGTLQPGSEVLHAELVHPDDMTLTEEAFVELIAAPMGTTRRIEFRLHLGPGPGAFRWVDAIATNLLDDPDVAGVVVNAQDVTERHEHEDRLDHLANHDPLTELPNRFAFERRLADRLDAGLRPFAVCCIDLDHFKRVNDSLGHHAGDDLLRVMAHRIGIVAGDDAIVARLGGDEFAVLADCTDLDDAEVLAGRLRYAIGQDVFLGTTRIHVDASIGVDVADIATPSDPVSLMRNVDIAMYEAKALGRGQIVRFDVSLREQAERRVELETAVRRAVTSEELVVHYQPLISAANGETVGLEALVRWQHPTRGVLLPAEFLAVAERIGLSARIEEQVLAAVLADLSADPDLPRVWVNLSVLELSRPRHTRRITTAAIEADVPLARLGFEMTESALATDTEAVRENLAWLGDRGARLALDDYGSGYASLANLRQLPIDELKIDQSLIARMMGEPFDLAVVQAIVQIARSLGLGVIAEGIETAEQAGMARELGIATLQGFLFAHPESIDANRSHRAETQQICTPAPFAL